MKYFLAPSSKTVDLTAIFERHRLRFLNYGYCSKDVKHCFWLMNFVECYGSLDFVIRFAFVSFNSHEDASNAMEKMQGKLLKGRNLAISFSRKASDSLSEGYSGNHDIAVVLEFLAWMN